MLLIRFLSDYSVAANGFRLEWRIQGCGGVLRKVKVIGWLHLFVHLREALFRKPKLYNTLILSFQDHAHFTSPNYPNIYPNAIECVWLIQTTLGSKIELTITEFDLEPSQGRDGNCHFDELNVYGGPDRTSPRLTHLCQKQTTPTVVTSQGNNMLVTFSSDGSITGKGFDAHYTKKEGGKNLNAHLSIKYDNNHISISFLRF